ncbi:hypothetical protein HNR40_004498 [Nonomuraea endophytica]|uniref:Uncharacterized protein n=1 Tax=Nonomuraea endophytica TaxID=714136 RepID=A0A7W8A3P1_9ACTN|nr:hypothetical protein [Nonomuraea endophytica]
MSITTLLEVLFGILLVFSTIITIGVLWTPPPRNRKHH